MPILTDSGHIMQNEWRFIADSEPVEEHKKIIVSLERLQRDWRKLADGKVDIGVELEPETVLEDLQWCLHQLSLIRLRFQTFTDGRLFSQAKLLRDRYRYSGDICAVGDVIQDQFSFMQRCGFNQFEVSEGVDRLLLLQALSEISVGYQQDMI